MKPKFGFCFIPDRLRDDRSDVLHLRIEHYGVTRYIPTSYNVRRHEWNAATGVPVISGNTANRRRLAGCARSMARNLRLVEGIIGELSRATKRFTADDVANAYNRVVAGNHMLGVYAAILADDLAFRNQPRVARAYQTAARRLIAFNGGYDIDMGDITPETMDAFQHALTCDAVSLNTVSFYMRTLRAIYNKAVAEGIIRPCPEDPFGNVYTEVPVAAKQNCC